jgi:hypothetical protein
MFFENGIRLFVFIIKKALPDNKLLVYRKLWIKLRNNTMRNFVFLAFVASLLQFNNVFANASIISFLTDDDAVASLNRSDNIPSESIDGVSDSYFEGYIQALVDMHYYEYQVVVIVKDKKVWLGNLPKNKLVSTSIISFVRDVPEVKDVKVLDEVPPKDIADRDKYVNRPQVSGIWFPQTTELFQPLVANPRQVTYSIGYRTGDTVVGTHAIALSYGDDFPIFRWLDVLPWRGDLQLGIDAGIWSVFNVDVSKATNINGGTELVNTDYYVAIPITYAVNNWAFRARVYHVSSHLGDEFLVNHPDYVNNVTIKGAQPVRKNPSFEAVDVFTSYQATDYLRLYIGPGVILHSDRTFPMKHFYVEYGGEVRFWSVKMYYHRLNGTCFAGVFFRNWQMNKWDIDGTYVAGYEWSKLQGVGRKMRMFVEFHHGFSLEGQFMKDRTTYGSFRFSYGF